MIQRLLKWFEPESQIQEFRCCLFQTPSLHPHGAPLQCTPTVHPHSAPPRQQQAKQVPGPPIPHSYWRPLPCPAPVSRARGRKDWRQAMGIHCMPLSMEVMCAARPLRKGQSAIRPHHMRPQAPRVSLTHPMHDTASTPHPQRRPGAHTASPSVLAWPQEHKGDNDIGVHERLLLEDFFQQHAVEIVLGPLSAERMSDDCRPQYETSNCCITRCPVPMVSTRVHNNYPAKEGNP